MNYNCDTCNYSTNIKSNFIRHNDSVAHKKKLGVLSKVTIKKKEYICDCKKIFLHRSGLSRHKKICDIFINKIEVIELKDQVCMLMNNLEKNNILLQEMIKKTDQTMIVPQVINNNSNNTSYKLSVKNYVQKNYPDAPALAAPTDYAKLTFDNQELIDTLLYYYRHKSLHKHLGDFVIGYYKKKDPENQSLWASDVSRLTYIIKESLAGKDSIWNHDPKGNKTKKYIISPILEHIRKYLNDCWDKMIEGDEIVIKGKRKKKEIDLDVDALEKRQKIFNSIHAIRTDIDNGIIADDILKYIASELHIDMSNKIKQK